MLTAAQKARCAELARSLDRGDVNAYTRAEDSLSVEERMLIWELRTDFTALAERGRQILDGRKKTHEATSISRVSERSRPAVAKPARVETELLSRDLDYWADDIAPDDDDPPDDQPVCSGCRGSGKDAAGNPCVICKGKGRIPAEDQPDSDNEDFDYEREFEEEE